MTDDPNKILESAFLEAKAHIGTPFVKDKQILERVEYVSTCVSNRAGVRLLLACALAKSHKPNIDIRKPYTEIKSDDSYSGRTYDEGYVANLINKYNLPCNSTTAFLTPSLRNQNTILTPKTDLVGRPPELYKNVLILLNDVAKNKITATLLLKETLRQLIIFKTQGENRIESLLKELKQPVQIKLSSEDVIELLQLHLKSGNASRLPVLIVAAAYKSASKYLGESVLDLKAHNSADKQTGAIGDVQITLIDDNNIVTSYEMKMKRVTKGDIDNALAKVLSKGAKIDNYNFITTEKIDEDVADYAKSLYQKTGGVEFAILDCIGFIRHFLHLFHRIRIQFLDTYQELVLKESDSAVSRPLKEVFLSLRRAAESKYDRP